MENLVLPISESSVCGEYLKGNKTLYRALRNSFNQAQSTYRQLMESPEAMLDDQLVDANTENWMNLAQLCQDCLQKDSKDTEVFCWFITAQIYTSEPLANLHSAFQVFAQSLTAFWPDMHPKPPVEKLKSDDDAGREMEWATFRVKPIWQLAGESEGSGILAMPLQNLPLIGHINYTQFFSAERGGELGSLKEEAKQFFVMERDAITEKIINLDGLRNQILNIEKTVNNHCLEVKATAISFKFLLKVVDHLLNALKYLVGDLIIPWPLDKIADDTAPIQEEVLEEVESDTVAAVSEPKSAPQSQFVSLANSDEIYTRDQAFAQLRKLSEFFVKTEPHSPIHMLLERAIRWGYMSLPELLEEMVGDNDQVMYRIKQMAGLESIEKTVIPDASISVKELEMRQMQASSQEHSAPSLSISNPATESKSKVPESNSVAKANETKASESSSDTTASSGISNFNW